MTGLRYRGKNPLNMSNTELYNFISDSGKPKTIKPPANWINKLKGIISKSKPIKNTSVGMTAAGISSSLAVFFFSWTSNLSSDILWNFTENEFKPVDLHMRSKVKTDPLDKKIFYWARTKLTVNNKIETVLLHVQITKVIDSNNQ